MANQPPPVSAQPPPEMPNLKGADSTTLSEYLRRFSLWCRNRFDAKIDASAAQGSLLLQAYDVTGTGSVFALRADHNGLGSLSQVGLASGAFGTPKVFYDTTNPAGYQTAAQVTAALAPYELITNVPTASTTNPVMDGVADDGVDTHWSKGDHVHPVDTSRYAASNPSGFQTAAQVNTSLSSYLPLTGGTIATGPMTFHLNSTIFEQVSGTTVGISFNDTSNAQQAQVYFNTSTGYYYFQNVTGGGSAYINSSGNFQTTGKIYSDVGYSSRNGSSGTFDGHVFNIYYPSAAPHLYIDTTDMGAFAYVSDYRLKTDVGPLPSMWDRNKTLNPISYKFKAWNPSWVTPNAINPMFKTNADEQWGFTAHELQDALISSAASGVKDQANLVQSPNPWTVLAVLTKTLQEAQTRIETLEAKVGP